MPGLGCFMIFVSLLCIQFSYIFSFSSVFAGLSKKTIRIDNFQGERTTANIWFLLMHTNQNQFHKPTKQKTMCVCVLPPSFDGAAQETRKEVVICNSSATSMTIAAGISSNTLRCPLANRHLERVSSGVFWGSKIECFRGVPTALRSFGKFEMVAVAKREEKALMKNLGDLLSQEA